MAWPRVAAYLSSMSFPLPASPARFFRFGLGAVWLAVMAGCAAEGTEPRGGVAAAREPAAIMPGDYLYYSSYNVYYNREARQYVFLQGGVWVSRTLPEGVPLKTLQASPVVRMVFHDTPDSHNAERLRQHPNNWAPPGATTPPPG